MDAQGDPIHELKFVHIPPITFKNDATSLSQRTIASYVVLGEIGPVILKYYIT